MARFRSSLRLVVATAAVAALSVSLGGCGRRSVPEVPKAEQPAANNPLIGFSQPAPKKVEKPKPKRDFVLDPLL